MYRRPKFLETLINIRLEMAEEAGQDIEIFVESVRTGKPAKSVIDKKTSNVVERQSVSKKAAAPRPVAK